MNINSYWEVRIIDFSAFNQGSEDADLPRVSGRRGGPLGTSVGENSALWAGHSHTPFPRGQDPSCSLHTFQLPGTSTRKDRALCYMKQGRGLVDAGVAAGEEP